MKIAICDDEKAVLEKLTKTINGLLQKGDELQSFLAPEELYKAHEQEPFDTIFLDIEMPGIDGIKLGLELKKVYPHTYVVYITRFQNFAFEAFRIRAFHYLKKPVSAADLNWILADIRDGVSLPPIITPVSSRDETW